ncbi:MAG TPA: phosphopantetheine-binding protein [Actinoplanes sp.]|jgi:acyl carrier protein
MSWSPAFEDLLRRHCRFVAADEPIEAEEVWPALGVDSFATLILILELEETFGVSIPDSLLTGTEFSTPGLMWSTLNGLLAEQA